MPLFYMKLRTYISLSCIFLDQI